MHSEESLVIRRGGQARQEVAEWLALRLPIWVVQESLLSLKLSLARGVHGHMARMMAPQVVAR